MIDEKDIKILNLLQESCRVSNAEIARRLGMAPSAILERIRKLEKKGVIKGYELRIDPKAIGLTLTVITLIKTDEDVGSTRVGKELAEIQHIQEVYFIAGEYSYMVKARVADTDALTALLQKMGEVQGIRDTRTTFVLNTIKESAGLYLQAEPRLHKK
ncbi:Lrp/AsnC family transcriptional regulator [Desulfonatronovibrio magnus]|uniref:Lrp/AsnC family transcriptional regulator n=1 Tax=Desulfonatronovibrio magnus TaxID=698827 RepID=UPI0005EB1D8F|nr:Lrp/AsnC family transcriptional regulator [Desulfonatronovibrio magnus]RQD62531.1 MAG: Lrp/AsnC family transcriptional regulator [Desulfonatronovibrio sp. MSAO_Bac4]